MTVFGRISWKGKQSLGCPYLRWPSAGCQEIVQPQSQHDIPPNAYPYLGGWVYFQGRLGATASPIRNLPAESGSTIIYRTYGWCHDVQGARHKRGERVSSHGFNYLVSRFRWRVAGLLAIKRLYCRVRLGYKRYFVRQMAYVSVIFKVVERLWNTTVVWRPLWSSIAFGRCHNYIDWHTAIWSIFFWCIWAPYWK